MGVSIFLFYRTVSLQDDKEYLQNELNEIYSEQKEEAIINNLDVDGILAKKNLETFIKEYHEAADNNPFVSLQSVAPYISDDVLRGLYKENIAPGANNEISDAEIAEIRNGEKIKTTPASTKIIVSDLKTVIEGGDKQVKQALSYCKLTIKSANGKKSETRNLFYDVQMQYQGQTWIITAINYKCYF